MNCLDVCTCGHRFMSHSAGNGACLIQYCTCEKSEEHGEWNERQDEKVRWKRKN